MNPKNRFRRIRFWKKTKFRRLIVEKLRVELGIDIRIPRAEYMKYCSRFINIWDFGSLIASTPSLGLQRFIVQNEQPI